MSYSESRRAFLLSAAAFSLTTATALLTGAEECDAASAQAQFASLEKSLNGRLGVYALNTADGSQMSYRADERFPLCSTFKIMLASAILHRSARTPELLGRRIRYTAQDLVTYSPITEKHVGDGMTIAELCAAALQYSDNTAANQLMKILGGPAAVTAFSRLIGDRVFHLDRWETELNTAIPGDLRDTSTPRAMGRSLKRLALGDALPPHQRRQLQEWMRGNTTGKKRIAAGVPANWLVGDKTGTGDYGSANDVAILWPPRHAPILLAIYTTQHEKNAKAREDVIASAARIVAGAII
ncbi:beta-lactamase [Capsulimonas corticalis]|uniref:Beta-lactamase n=1 Tax=Capsulimonas corticalis TaxID=2219043 RepID=A0A402CT55_9BACT|nr:class A beta-lactamase [Capsulimonas corticalis]BDI30844.1 beta-lactamase [Capsulimonas corticalis]